MRKHFNKLFDETYYTEVLDNGLNVFIFHKPEFNTTVCAFGTPYGALKINEKFKNKEYHFNPGIAHFLEHKLFETKGDDMMNAFSALGANVNAFTSYKETVYYFSKTGEEIKQPLNLLLDFVQELNITQESVEKEKGIIAQEVASYQQIPDQRLLNETYKCLYHNYPMKYDIGGDKKTIYAITKQELEECYSINYHPSNMILCISSPINPKKIIKIVKDNQKAKNFKKVNKPTLINPKEPVEVVKKRYKFKMPISIGKHVLAYKIKPDFKDNNDAFKQEWATRILLDIYFSSLNPDYQNWLDKNIINDFFGSEVEFDLDAANILIFIENDDDSLLPKLVEETLKKDLLNDDILEQIKHRYLGIMFDVFNDIESFNTGYLRDMLSGLDFFDAIDNLKNISLSDVENCKKYFDCPHTSYVSMIKK